MSEACPETEVFRRELGRALGYSSLFIMPPGAVATNVSGSKSRKLEALLDAMPVAYAVTYIFGTVGSALVIALIGPAMLGIDLEAACAVLTLRLGSPPWRAP